ncbi:MAG TPA: hypothetical protein VFZ47_03725 [Chitinophagaceae bacterium]
MNFLFLLLVLFTSFAYAQQPMQISIIDFYGLQKVSIEDIRKRLTAKEGDSIHLFKKEQMVKEIRSTPGVVDVEIQSVCCDDKEGKWILYIGIAETKSAKATYHSTPTGTVKLPEEIMTAYDTFMNLVREAVMSGNAGENDSLGHAIMTYPPAKPVQDQLVNYAQQNLPLIREVLYKSANADQRQVASWIIAYNPDKKGIVKDLVFAVKDADEVVRNNATRGLAVIAKYANKHPELNINIPADPFIEMVNSIVWTDRNKGVAVLLALTQNRPPQLIQMLNQKASRSIIEMAKWKNAGHAEMNYLILARMAGIPEETIGRTFSDRKDASIAEMAAKILKNQ